MIVVLYFDVYPLIVYAIGLYKVSNKKMTKLVINMQKRPPKNNVRQTGVTEGGLAHLQDTLRKKFRC